MAKELLIKTKNFYCDLYSESNDNANIENYLHLINLLHISQNEFDLCENKLTILEIKKAIKDLAINMITEI